MEDIIGKANELRDRGEVQVAKSGKDSLFIVKNDDDNELSRIMAKNALSPDVVERKNRAVNLENPFYFEINETSIDNPIGNESFPAADGVP